MVKEARIHKGQPGVKRSKKLRERLGLRERRYEVKQLIKRKCSDDYEVLEEVFDYPTLMSIYKLLKRGIITSLLGVMKSGKESRIYRGRDGEGNDLAIKIFLVSSAEFRRGMLPYIEEDPRFESLRRSRRGLVYAWATKEFKNLKKAHSSGVRVPKPIAILKNVLVMEFVGREGVPAPLLKEVRLENPETTYRTLLEIIKRLYAKAELVHGDLSEYNVMMLDGEPILFDLSQAVLPEHPRAGDLLRRDLHNINNYFKRLEVRVEPLDKLERWVRSE